MIADLVIAPDENPMKPALRDIEQLAAYATAYRYPTPSGRIPNAPTRAELDALIMQVDKALREAVRRFGVELDKKGSPAVKPEPLR